LGFGVGADSAQGGVEGAEPRETQLFPDVTWCPGGLGGVGVAEQPQPRVGYGPDVGPGCCAEGEVCLVPGGTLVLVLVTGIVGEQRVDGEAYAGVDDGGDVAGSGQVAGGDGGADDVGGVQAGQFGGVQGAVQPPGTMG